MSWEHSGNVVFRQPKLRFSICEPAHPQGCKPTSWFLPDFAILKVFRHEAIVGNFGNEEGEAFQDEHREDTRNEAIRDIKRDYSEFRSGSLR